jgi:hypothetical protein
MTQGWAMAAGQLSAAASALQKGAKSRPAWYVPGVVAEVVVRKFDAPHEAELAAGYLREHGMPARVENDVLIGMNPLWGMALGGIRLFVRQIDAERADELLQELAQPVPAQALADTTRDADAVARRALAAAVFGFFLLPVVAQLYSLVLALPLRSTSLSARGRRHRLIAIAADVVVLGAFGWLVQA